MLTWRVRQASTDISEISLFSARDTNVVPNYQENKTFIVHYTEYKYYSKKQKYKMAKKRTSKNNVS